jgi:hypothetical protein
VGLASALLRNGLSVFGDLEIGAEDSVAATMSRRGKSKTKLQNLAEALEFEDAADLLQRRRIAGGSVVRFHVEAGADWTLFAAVYREKEDLELILVDPEGYVVDYEGSQSILMESASPLKNAIVKKPKPGVWKAVLARKTKGTAFKVYYYAQVENRRIAVHGEVAPLVPIGQTAVIHASATWKDLLSDLDVEARIRDPEGGLHMVSLSDKKYAEPNSGDYVGTFVPELPGRHSVELKISCRGNATLGGSIHRLLHGPAPSAKKAETFDIAAGAPAFIRRVPLYFDAGKRPIPVDNDDKSGGRIQFPVKPRKAALRPLNLQRVLKRSGANKSSSSAKQKRKKSQTR